MSEHECSISYDISVEDPSTSEEQRPIVKRAVLPSCPDPCKVCGGESTGYHYQVSSCNGCKSFFRRTIIDMRIFECLFDNDCLIPKQIHKKQKRRKCRACRFRRCVEVGMNPLGIVTDADENNVLPTKISTKRLVSIEDMTESSLENLLYSENKLLLLRKSVHNFRPDCGFTIEYLLNQFTPMGSSFPEMPPLSNWTMNLMNIDVILPLEDSDKYWEKSL
ncbi:hypothetical protein PRIPAC_82274 [Pristionchus pacificus]|nr:hypothetical protein PRIPAC_82274 [Pristionchus pacificus]